MNFDEQKLKRLDNIRLNDNQYENVNPVILKTKFKKAGFYSPFFLSIISIFINLILFL